jgi:hypothetical protein
VHQKGLCVSGFMFFFGIRKETRLKTFSPSFGILVILFTCIFLRFDIMANIFLKKKLKSQRF